MTDAEDRARGRRQDFRGWVVSHVQEDALFCPPKQQAVVVSYTTLSLKMNHHIPYIPQAVHSTTSLTIFFNPPKIHKPICGLVFGTL
jgi:hypothetical protein